MQPSAMWSHLVTALTWSMGVVAIGAALHAADAGAHDPASLVRSLDSAHSRVIAYEAKFRSPSVTTSELDALVDQANRFNEELTPFTDDRSSVPLRTLFKGRFLSDEAGRLRIETRALVVGGPAEQATRFELWDGLVRTLSAGPRSSSATLSRYEPLSINDQFDLRKSGRVSAEFLRAQTGYLPLVRYIVDILGSCSDLDGPNDTGDRHIGICSRDWGIAAEIDTSTFELSRAMLIDEQGTCTLFECIGRFDDPMFPARHPRQLRAYALGRFAIPSPIRFSSPPEKDPGRLTLFDSVRTLSSPDPTTFQWQSVAIRVLDGRSGRFLHADGSADPASPQAPTLQLISIDPTDSTRTTIAGGRSNFQRSLWAGGIAAVLLAFCLWARRRWQ